MFVEIRKPANFINLYECCGVFLRTDKNIKDAPQTWITIFFDEKRDKDVIINDEGVSIVKLLSDDMKTIAAYGIKKDQIKVIQSYDDFKYSEFYTAINSNAIRVEL